MLVTLDSSNDEKCQNRQNWMLLFWKMWHQNFRAFYFVWRQNSTHMTSFWSFFTMEVERREASEDVLVPWKDKPCWTACYHQLWNDGLGAGEMGQDRKTRRDRVAGWGRFRTGPNSLLPCSSLIHPHLDKVTWQTGRLFDFGFSHVAWAGQWDVTEVMWVQDGNGWRSGSLLLLWEIRALAATNLLV